MASVVFQKSYLLLGRKMEKLTIRTISICLKEYKLPEEREYAFQRDLLQAPSLHLTQFLDFIGNHQLLHSITLTYLNKFSSCGVPPQLFSLSKTTFSKLTI